MIQGSRIFEPSRVLALVKNALLVDPVLLIMLDLNPSIVQAGLVVKRFTSSISPLITNCNCLALPLYGVVEMTCVWSMASFMFAFSEIFFLRYGSHLIFLWEHAKIDLP